MDWNDARKCSNQAEGLSDRCFPIFAGQPPEVVGAALADLVAVLIASHSVPGNPEMTSAVRRALMTAFVNTVHDLVLLHDQDKAKEKLH